MQTPATVPTPTAAASPPHARVARGTAPVSPQPAVAAEGFEASLAQAQATPACVVATLAKPGIGGTPTLLSIALPAQAPINPLAVPAANVAKAAVKNAPGTAVTESEQDKAPLVANGTDKGPQPLAHPPVEQPAPLPDPTVATLVITLSGGIDAALPDVTAPLATGIEPAQANAGQAAPTALAPALNAAALPGAGAAILHAGPERPLAVGEHEAMTPAPDSALEPTAAISSMLPPSVPSLAAALHAPAPLPPINRPAAAAAPPPTSPAEQVGPVLASFAASAAQPNAAQHLTIRLDPAELGHVQVRIERMPDGPARVELVVERPDTLLLLLRDQPELHRALDLAGVPAADRTLQFQLAPAAADPGTTTPQFNADPGPGQQRPGQPRQHGANNGRSVAHDDPTIRPAAAFRRAGVNIMA